MRNSLGNWVKGWSGCCLITTLFIFDSWKEARSGTGYLYWKVIMHFRKMRAWESVALWLDKTINYLSAWKKMKIILAVDRPQVQTEWTYGGRGNCKDDTQLIWGCRFFRIMKNKLAIYITPVSQLVNLLARLHLESPWLTFRDQQNVKKIQEKNWTCTRVYRRNSTATQDF